MYFILIVFYVLLLSPLYCSRIFIVINKKKEAKPEPKVENGIVEPETKAEPEVLFSLQRNL